MSMFQVVKPKKADRRAVQKEDTGQERAAGMAEEQELLESFMNGNRQAAEDLVDRTYRPIYAFLYRLCGDDENLASDLTQETYQKAWRSLAEFDGRSQFSTWLYRIAYNSFLNHTRRPLRVVPVDEKIGPATVDLKARQEEEIADREMKEHLKRAVLSLPDDLRFAITARYWGELSVRDIARMEQVSVVAVRKRLKRALKSLSQFFGGQQL